MAGHRVSIRTAALVGWSGDGVADLALPDATRRQLRVVTVAGGRITDLWTQDRTAPIAKAIHAADLDGDGTTELVYGLEDGTLVAVRR